jgi:tetratricopeptide (TPR) repeat protein
MLGIAWLTLRQAQEALRNGRLEEAQRLLGQGAAQGHKRSWELLQQLAQAFVARGERHLQRQDPEAAWSDLLHAEQIGVEEGGITRLRQALVRQSVGQANALLEAGEPSRAGEILAQLRGRSVRSAELEVLEEAARHWTVARDLAGRGDFAQALQTVERARRLLPGNHPALDQFQREVEQKAGSFSALLGKLHEAANQARWRDVIDLSEQVLAAAPQHAEARKARARAWKAIEPVTVAEKCTIGPAPSPDAPSSPRFLLWIDGVGGFLVCLAPKVTLGQATPEGNVDLPLFADISRVHATLTRDVEGYLLEAHRPVQINGKTVDKALLQPNDRVTLGSACQFQFRQPVPVSATARLDLTSGHRLPLAVDGVLLMADTLVLGPGLHVHVTMPDMKDTVVLFRNKDGLGVRYAGKMSVDGHSCRERGTLGPSSSVMGDNFAFAVEPVGTRLGRM